MSAFAREIVSVHSIISSLLQNKYITLFFKVLQKLNFRAFTPILNLRLGSESGFLVVRISANSQ